MFKVFPEVLAYETCQARHIGEVCLIDQTFIYSKEQFKGGGSCIHQVCQNSSNLKWDENIRYNGIKF